MDALDAESAVAVDVHVAVGSVREHEELGAFLGPEDRRRRVALGGALELDDAVEADLLVARLVDENRRSCKKSGLSTVGWAKMFINFKLANIALGEGHLESKDGYIMYACNFV